jgi:hypothetical protein
MRDVAGDTEQTRLLSDESVQMRMTPPRADTGEEDVVDAGRARLLRGGEDLQRRRDFGGRHYVADRFWRRG